MSPSNHRIDQLCKNLIAETWGDRVDFPEELSSWADHICREFIVSYLNFLRQKEAKPSEWVPEKLVIDWGLVDDMRHFFSDYQHITKRFYKLNREMERLGEMDKDRHLKLYQFTIDKILEVCKPQDIPGGQG